MKRFLILVLHLRQFFIVRIFVKRATGFMIIILFLTIFDGIMRSRRNGLSEQWAVGKMGRRSNGLSEEWVPEKWAVGIMGCRNYDPTPFEQCE